MNALAMAVGGGFFGTSVACTVAFFFARWWVRSKLEEWLADAHAKGACPACGQAIAHDSRSPPSPDAF